MLTKTEPTYTVDIYMAGDIANAKQVCREYCFAVGLCVNVIAADFIYTGGEEAGVKVGLLNYPRFPSSPDAIWETAKKLAETLMPRLCQHSALLVASDKTEWLTTRADNAGAVK